MLSICKKGNVVGGAAVHVSVAQLRGIWEVTAWVLLIFLECSRDRSSMF
jgi:hypothetical protein